MKILFISYENPLEGKAGDTIYTYNILTNLQIFKPFIHFLSYGETKPKSGFEQSNRIWNSEEFVFYKRKSKLRLVCSFYPLSIANRKRNLFIQKTIETIKTHTFDYVVINHFKMSFIIDHLNKNTFKTVYISHNVETNLSKSLYQFTNLGLKKILYYFEYIKTKYFEKRYLKKFDIITGISDFDVECLKLRFTKKKIFLLSPLVIQHEIHPLNINLPLKVILCGSFTWEPKRENLIRLLNTKNFQKLYENNIELMIVGNAPLELVTKVNTKYKGVKMTGFVESTIDYYKQSLIALVPELLGGGFKLKIAEAVGFNIPIVALNISVTDREMKNGVHYIGVNSFDEMIDSTIKLIQDVNKMSLISKNASELFEKKYSKVAIEKNVSRIFEEEMF